MAKPKMMSMDFDKYYQISMSHWICYLSITRQLRYYIEIISLAILGDRGMSEIRVIFDIIYVGCSSKGFRRLEGAGGIHPWCGHG